MEAAEWAAGYEGSPRRGEVVAVMESGATIAQHIRATPWRVDWVV